ncbi:MAG: hypothetical protein HZB30_10525 [Nitrospirae bacterium]|nr:hypothetical protein [Nitrospirota bacterium]
MKIANKNSVYWKKQEDKFKVLEKEIKIPNEKLDNVDFVLIKKETDLKKIPDRGGCYWIWTNEPVNHRLHKKLIPSKIKNGEIIYNGIAKDNVRLRIKHHLLGEIDAGWSGISLDIYQSKSQSHRKKAMSPNGKVPFVACDLKNEPIRTKDLLSFLFLSREEKKYITNSVETDFFFRNGINVSDKKHRNFKFVVYFIRGSEQLFLEYIEKKWREKYELPKLCSYTSGR